MADATTQTGAEETYDRIHRKTWSKRTSGFLGAATLFGAVGALGGLVASLLPAALSGLGVEGVAEASLPTAATMLGNAAVFAAATGWLGITIGADVGANAGAATTALEERAAAKGRSLEKSAQPQPAPTMFRLKPAILMAATFAAFGALAALSPITAPVVALLGFKAGTAAASVACATVLGMFGATMGVNFPVISNKLANKYSAILSGKAFEEPEPAIAPQPQLQPQQAAAIEEQPTLQAEATTSKHREKLVRFSVTNITQRTEEKPDHTHCNQR